MFRPNVIELYLSFLSPRKALTPVPVAVYPHPKLGMQRFDNAAWRNSLAQKATQVGTVTARDGKSRGASRRKKTLARRMSGLTSRSPTPNRRANHDDVEATRDVILSRYHLEFIGAWLIKAVGVARGHRTGIGLAGVEAG